MNKNINSIQNNVQENKSSFKNPILTERLYFFKIPINSITSLSTSMSQNRIISNPQTILIGKIILIK